MTATCKPLHREGRTGEEGEDWSGTEREREGGGKTTGVSEKWASVERKARHAASGVGGKLWMMLVQVFTAGV